MVALTTAPEAQLESRPAPCSFVVYREDMDGVPYAVQITDADEWDDDFLTPPAIDVADVRIVRLRRVGGPDCPPRWLRILGQFEEGELEATATDGLWNWSPYYRAPSSPLDEFLRAGAVALRHPEPAPTDAQRQLDALSSFARRSPEFHPLAVLRHLALERWLQARFGEPETFADAVLLARLEDVEPVLAHELQFLRASRIPQDTDVHRALSVDRDVLLGALSAWRVVEGREGLEATLAALRRWRSRYRRAYAVVYRGVVLERDRLLTEARPIEVACDLLDESPRLHASDPAGRAAVARYRAAAGALRAMPDDPDPLGSCTGGVQFDAPGRQLDEFRMARDAIRPWTELCVLRWMQAHGPVAVCATPPGWLS